MSQARPLPRSGLYFIDVLACLLFCLTLALVGARFQRDHAVEIELPRTAAEGDTGATLDTQTITIRNTETGPVLHLDDRALSLEELETHLQNAPPPAVLIRAERTALSRVITAAHGAGVHDIQLAYERDPKGGNQ